MGLEKGILYGKEHRKPFYNKAKRCSHECRNHGECPWCRDNRLYSSLWRLEQIKDEIKEILDDDGYNS